MCQANGLLINFSGTCNENIDILRDDITIRGTTPTATINGDEQHRLGDPDRRASASGWSH